MQDFYSQRCFGRFRPTNNGRLDPMEICSAEHMKRNGRTEKNEWEKRPLCKAFQTEMRWLRSDWNAHSGNDSQLFCHNCVNEHPIHIQRVYVCVFASMCAYNTVIYPHTISEYSWWKSSELCLKCTLALELSLSRSVSHYVRRTVSRLVFKQRVNFMPSTYQIHFEGAKYTHYSKWKHTHHTHSGQMRIKRQKT